MNITAKILPAHYFPNIILFKIFNRINLIFGVTIVAVDLKLLRKNKIKLPITIFSSLQAKNILIFFGPMATAQKVIWIKKFKFSAFQRHLYNLNVYDNRIFIKKYCAACRPSEYLCTEFSTKYHKGLKEKY